MGLLVTLLTLLDTQCAVRIENPQAMTLALFEVTDDTSGRRRVLGEDERYGLRLRGEDRAARPQGAAPEGRDRRDQRAPEELTKVRSFQNISGFLK